MHYSLSALFYSCLFSHQILSLILIFQSSNLSFFMGENVAHKHANSLSEVPKLTKWRSTISMRSYFPHMINPKRSGMCWRTFKLCNLVYAYQQKQRRYTHILPATYIKQLYIQFLPFSLHLATGGINLLIPRQILQSRLHSATETKHNNNKKQGALTFYPHVYKTEIHPGFTIQSTFGNRRY